MDLHRAVFIDKKMWVNKPLDIHSVANANDEIVFSVNMWNTVNQSLKHDFSCG